MKSTIIALLTLGVLVILRVILFYAFPLQLQDGSQVRFTTTILDDPKSNRNFEQVGVILGNFWQSTSVVLLVPKNAPLLYGNSVTITGRATKKVLNNKNVVTAIYFPKIKAESGGFLGVFGRIRQELINFCEKTFSQPYSSLFLGILFGIKTQLGRPLTISFRITGVTHVIAASGMNVTLVGGFLAGIFGRVVKRQWAIVATIGGIIFYTILSGLDASIVRAACMSILAFGAQLLGRQYTAFYGLFLASGGMLFLDPLLLQNVGFQLSVISTLGILLIKPIIPLKGFLLDDIGTTLAAQIATLPILLMTFGSYGLLSLVVNALVLWTIPLIMVIGGVGVGVGLVFQQLGRLIAFVTFPLLWYFVGVVEIFAKFNWTVEITNVSLFLVVGYYCILVSVILVKKRQTPLVTK